MSGKPQRRGKGAGAGKNAQIGSSSNPSSSSGPKNAMQKTPSPDWKTDWMPDSGSMREIREIEELFTDGHVVNGAQGHVFKPGTSLTPSVDVQQQEDKTRADTSKPQMNSLVLKESIQQRPGYGGSGATSFALHTNYLHLETPRSQTIYRYNIRIGELVNLRDGKKKRGINPRPTIQGGPPIRPAASAQAGTSQSRTTQSSTAQTPISQTPTTQSTSLQSGSQTNTNDEKPQQGLIRKRRQMFDILLRHQIFQAAGKAVATDYAAIVLTAKALDLSQDIVIHYSAEDGGDEDPEGVNVQITLEKQLAVDDLKSYLSSPFDAKTVEVSKELVQALNIIMKYGPSKDSTLVVGGDNSKFFPLLGESSELRACVIALKGYYTSVRTSTARLLINLNVCTSAFYQEGRVDAAMRSLGVDADTAMKEQGEKAETFLKKRRVYTRYMGSMKFKTIYGFRPGTDGKIFLTANTARFTPQDEMFGGREVSVTEYFRIRWERKLESPHLPLLNLGIIQDKSSKEGKSISDKDNNSTPSKDGNITPSKDDKKTPSKDGKSTVSKDGNSTSSKDDKSTPSKDGKYTPGREDKGKSVQVTETPERPKKVNPTGTPSPEVRYQLVPPELCYILPGQPYGKKLEGAETDKMKDFAARPPAENARRIVDAAGRVIGLSPDNPCLKGFGLQVSPDLITVSARNLPPPKLTYHKSGKNGGSVYPSLGSWTMGGQGFHRAAPIGNWSYLDMDGTFQPKTREHIQTLATHFGKCGLGPSRLVHEAGYPLDIPNSPHEIDESIRKAFDELDMSKVKIVLVLLKEKESYVYSRLKYISETEFGIHTVCTVASKFAGKMNGGVDRCDGTYAWNLALKFNLKLGGANHALALDRSPPLENTMVIGIDVSHPSQTKLREAKSIAGVVANRSSMDFSQWPCSLRTQPGGTEIVEAMQEMVAERLKAWTGPFPQKFLIYRDGVSEDQYDDVLQYELPCIKRAIQARIGKGKFQIALVIVAKRHHTRFYPTNHDQTDKNKDVTNDKMAESRKGNPLPGTIVDRGITMETGWDFYLQAHDCLQGTAKPAHYIVLRSEVPTKIWSANTLEKMTHEFSYLFGRATKTISICAPAYYAHLACERGKVYLHKYYQHPELFIDDKKPDDAKSDDANLDIAKSDEKKPVEQNLDDKKPNDKKSDDKKLEWNGTIAPWTKTVHKPIFKDNDPAKKIIGPPDKLADTMFYI